MAETLTRPDAGSEQEDSKSADADHQARQQEAIDATTDPLLFKARKADVAAGVFERQQLHDHAGWEREKAAELRAQANQAAAAEPEVTES